MIQWCTFSVYLNLNGTVYIGPHRTYHRSGVTGTRMANWARTLNKNYQTRKLAFRLNYIFYFIEEMSEKRKRMFTRKVFIRLVTLKSRISYYRNFKKHLEINNVYLSFTSSATNKSVKSKVLRKFTSLLQRRRLWTVALRHIQQKPNTMSVTKPQ